MCDHEATGVSKDSWGRFMARKVREPHSWPCVSAYETITAHIRGKWKVPSGAIYGHRFETIAHVMVRFDA